MTSFHLGRDGGRAVNLRPLAPTRGLEMECSVPKGVGSIHAEDGCQW